MTPEVLVLAIDTALSATSVAVLDGDQALADLSEAMGRGHQERVAGLAQQAMRLSGASFGDLDLVGVTVGPGSFTGLRVGLAFAKCLALALDVPCVGVSTLAALAETAAVPGVSAAAIDARRGQLYLQAFCGRTALFAPLAASVEDARARLTERGGGQIVLIGSGAAELADLPGVQVDPRLSPSALAVGRLARFAPAPASAPRPLYLRAPDAKTIAERKRE